MEKNKEIFSSDPEREFKIKEIKRKIAELYRKNENFSHELCNFVSDLRKKYADAEDYLLYHILIGSTPAEENPPQKYDFPGEDSIEKFIEKLHQELMEK